AGGAAINQLCQTFGVDLRVEAMALDQPTRDITEEAAMDETACVQALSLGLSVVEDDMDVLCLGEMGIGNTTSAAALCHALHGGAASQWTGPGAGVKGEALRRKAVIVSEAVALHKDQAADALDILRRLGGRELAAIAGAVAAARIKRVPVMLDGYVCTAAAAVLHAQAPGALDHCQVGHASAEPGHMLLLGEMGVEPLLKLDMRLGEASGAVLAVGLLKAAAACHGGMATFGGAGVSGRED
ncbi:MAG TPA: nicotinate-nucleotide--dimethylbenzimidazole phosphoribosyltransferase, partial [Rhodospirillales bacterium]|nr:nicotinate-nucleotide--dimethylbenzimidazole phosphoribosyltransferase [Rhodospirillales bacterium]